MKIETGQGRISLIALVGIWSISALNALPGLAVSPILNKVSQIFPEATELDVQMLSSLPALLTIPFILLSGFLTQHVNNIKLLRWGLWIFTISGILYLFSNKMWQLIAISGMLGAGSGMIVPLSTGLITRFFVGSYRIKQFGYSSAITNITLVIATIVTGYLAEINWHLPFLVYLLPIVSIILSIKLKDTIAPGKKLEASTINITVKDRKINTKSGLDTKNLIEIMAFYGTVTYLAVLVTLNLTFLTAEYNISSGTAGQLIAVFFLAIMLPGLFLNKIITKLKNLTLFSGVVMITAGLFLIIASKLVLIIGTGCALTGLGYGIIQPSIYNKTTSLATSKKVTMALAFVMAMNYGAILICPFIISAVSRMFDTHSQVFPFIFNGSIALLTTIWAYKRKDSFLFSQCKEEEEIVKI
ncbi:MAG: MFS transporter [Bacteroidales bacterium]